MTGTVSAIVSAKCPCGREPEVKEWHHGWLVTCPNCYDPSEDSGCRAHLQGFGVTRDAAVNDWNLAVEDES